MGGLGVIFGMGNRMVNAFQITTFMVVTYK